MQLAKFIYSAAKEHNTSLGNNDAFPRRDDVSYEYVILRRRFNKVVEEVKQSEEWEAVRMNILDIGIQKGLAEGRAEGLAEGITAYIGLCRELDISADETKEKIVQNFSLSYDEAEKYMQQYWK